MVAFRAVLVPIPAAAPPVSPISPTSAHDAANSAMFSGLGLVYVLKEFL